MTNNFFKPSKDEQGNIIASEFSQRLRELRTNKKISQQTMSRKLGVGLCTYGTYETSRYLPPVDTLSELADYYNVSTDYLLGKTDDRYSENEGTDKLNFSDECMDRLVDISKNETQKKILEDIITGKDFFKLLSYIEEYKLLKDNSEIDNSKITNTSKSHYKPKNMKFSTKGYIRFTNTLFDLIQRIFMNILDSFEETE